MGVMHLLNALKKQAKTKKASPKGLMFMDVRINGKLTRAMIDTGATHNFVSDTEAAHLGSKVRQGLKQDEGHELESSSHPGSSQISASKIANLERACQLHHCSYG